VWRPRAVEVGEVLDPSVSRTILNGTSFKPGGLAVMAESVLQAAIFLVVCRPELRGRKGGGLVEDGSGQRSTTTWEAYPEREEDDGRPSYF